MYNHVSAEIDLARLTGLSPQFCDRLDSLAYHRSPLITLNSDKWIDSLGLDAHGRAACYIHLLATRQLTEQAEYSKSMARLSEMMTYTDQIPEQFAIFKIRIFRQFAYLNSLQSIYTPATRYYLDALEMAKSLGDTDETIQILVELAELNRKINVGKDALHYLGLATALVRGAQPSPATMAMYKNRRVAIQLHYYSKSIPPARMREELLEVLEAARLARDPYLEATTMNELGMASRDISGAASKKWLFQSAEIYRSIGAERDHALVLINLGIGYTRHGPMDCDSSKIWLDSCKTVVAGRHWNYISGMLAALKSVHHRYCSHDKDSIIYYDSIQNVLVPIDLKRRDSLKFAMLQTEREELDQQYVIDQQDKALRESEQVKTILIAFAVFVLLIVGVLSWLGRNLRKAHRATQKNEEALQIANAQLAKEVDEKAMLLGEVHHRVKNNLQLTANLLKAQAAQNQDASAKEELRKAENRILLMATLQDLLYQKENMTIVAMDIFLEQICEDVLNIAGDATTALQVACQGIALPHTLAINLGIMTQELVTNSCKYGRVAGQTMVLSLQLSAEGQQLIFEYQDNGPAIIAPDLESHTPKTGLGSFILHTLARQCNGEMVAIPHRPNAFSFRFQSPRYTDS